MVLANSEQVIERLGLAVTGDLPAEGQVESVVPTATIHSTFWQAVREVNKQLDPVTANSRVEMAEPDETDSGQAGPEEFLREPLGILHASGEVFVNDTRAPQEVTVFKGDAVRVGGASTAALAVRDKGEMLIYEKTQLSFGRGVYFSDLKQGTVALRSVAGAKWFEVQIGRFLVLPDPGGEANAEVARAADGSAVIRAYRGSVGIIAIEGGRAVFIRAGQEVYVSKEGELLLAAPPQEGPSAPPKEAAGARAGPSTEKPPKAHRTKWIGLGLAGGGAAAAAALLAAGGGGPTPVIPSAP
jgi:hypothetical protein